MVKFVAFIRFNGVKSGQCFYDKSSPPYTILIPNSVSTSSNPVSEFTPHPIFPPNTTPKNRLIAAIGHQYFDSIVKYTLLNFFHKKIILT